MFYSVSNMSHTKEFWQFPKLTQNWNKTLPKISFFSQIPSPCLHVPPLPNPVPTHLLYILEAEETEGNSFLKNSLPPSMPFVWRVLFLALVLVSPSHFWNIGISPNGDFARELVPYTKPRESYQLEANACFSPSPPYLSRVVSGPRSKVQGLA